MLVSRINCREIKNFNPTAPPSHSFWTSNSFQISVSFTAEVFCILLKQAVDPLDGGSGDRQGLNMKGEKKYEDS
jgi:hypothetical protein